MIFTPLIQKAIKFAIKTHDVYQKQTRKGKAVAYITHPLTVGIILARVGASEEVIAAGILHDTIEDSIAEKKVTKAMITERFGDPVAELVESVTEKRRDLPWEERKCEALGHISEFCHESILVKSADIISNDSEVVDDYARYGEEVFNRFSASKEKMIEHQLKTIAAIIKRWPENPLVDDLLSLAKELKRIGLKK